ncbi:5'-AMP-activated protein kinase-related [Forsythia ovata]|uniref:5'-AMP-activated protein kinase-related n=2 Tax=Forsythia ovata TaxID=205694 RepID=A0ABD1WER8_9LAMI
MFTLINSHAHITKFHHPILHSSYLVTPSLFCVYNPKRRPQRYRKSAIFSRSWGFLEVKRLRKFEGSNGSFRCFWRKESDGDAELEAEIMEFMEKSENPTMFPTKEEFLKAGRRDLVEAIKKRGGWYSLGWEGENVEEDVDFNIEEFQRRVESCSESSSLGENDVNSFSGLGENEEELYSGINSRQLASSSGKIGAEEDAGIEGILSRLEKQRNTDYGINLENYGFGTYASSKDERENRHVGTSIDVEDIADPGKRSRLTSGFAHKGILDNSGGMISLTNEPEAWRTWSSQQAGFQDAQYEST